MSPTTSGLALAALVLHAARCRLDPERVTIHFIGSGTPMGNAWITRMAGCRLTTGAVKLHDTARDAEYQIGKRTIFDLRDKDAMWLDDWSPCVRGNGDPKQDSAQCVIDGLPDGW